MSRSVFPQVLNVSLMEGEQVTVEDTGGREPFILANESVLMRGLVLRSWSNQISIRFRRDQENKSGSIQLHYQGKPVGRNVLPCRPFVLLTLGSSLPFSDMYLQLLC